MTMSYKGQLAKRREIYPSGLRKKFRDWIFFLFFFLCVAVVWTQGLTHARKMFCLHYWKERLDRDVHVQTVRGKVSIGFHSGSTPEALGLKLCVCVATVVLTPRRRRADLFENRS